MESQDLEDRIRKLENADKFTIYESRSSLKRAAMFVVFGVGCAIAGFFIALISGLTKFFLESKDDKYPSGNGYFPATVSEMVHDFDDPAGRAFFAFMMVGALFIFLSYYPWKLQNCYFGDDDEVFGFSWPMLRQVLPTPGMMLVAMVPTTPIQQAGIRDFVTIAIHGVAAMVMFVGYPIIEGKTIGWAFFQAPTRAREYFVERQQELKWRRFWLTLGTMFFVIFMMFQAIFLPFFKFVDNPDKFEDDPQKDGKIMTDTAGKGYLFFKFASFMSEVFLGLCMLMNMLVIWRFSPERFINLIDDVQYKADIIGKESENNAIGGAETDKDGQPFIEKEASNNWPARLERE